MVSHSKFVVQAERMMLPNGVVKVAYLLEDTSAFTGVTQYERVFDEVTLQRAEEQVWQI